MEFRSLSCTASPDEAASSLVKRGCFNSPVPSPRITTVSRFGSLREVYHCSSPPSTLCPLPSGCLCARSATLPTEVISATTAFYNHPYGNQLDNCNQRTRHWHWGKLSSRDLLSALKWRSVGYAEHATGELGIGARGRETIDCG